MPYINKYCANCGWSGQRWHITKKCSACGVSALTDKVPEKVDLKDPLETCFYEGCEELGIKECHFGCKKKYCHDHIPKGNLCVICEAPGVRWPAQILSFLRRVLSS